MENRLETWREDNPPSLTEQPPTPFEKEAAEYWQMNLPETSRVLELQQPNGLLTHLRKVWWKGEYETLLVLAKHPDRSRPQVEEITLRPLLFPPPESATTQGRNRSTTR